MHRPRASSIGLLVSGAMLLAIAIFTVVHLSYAERFASLIAHAEPRWFGLAIALQIATYACAGGIWRMVAAVDGNRLRLAALARLAVEKLSVDQLLPSAGMSGNLVVARAMQRLGLPAPRAAEALLIDLLGYYAAFAMVAAASVAFLWLHHDLRSFMMPVLGVSALVLAVVPASIAWLVRHRDIRLGPRLVRLGGVQRVLAVVRDVSPQRVRDPRLLATSGGLHLAIFGLDAGTLWAVLHATGGSGAFSTAFIGLVVASLAATISFLPGGLGSFEAACVATLVLLGHELEHALAATIVLRGLTLWVPLVPGSWLARRDLVLGWGPAIEGHR